MLQRPTLCDLSCDFAHPPIYPSHTHPLTSRAVPTHFSRPHHFHFHPSATIRRLAGRLPRRPPPVCIATLLAHPHSTDGQPGDSPGSQPRRASRRLITTLSFPNILPHPIPISPDLVTTSSLYNCPSPYRQRPTASWATPLAANTGMHHDAKRPPAQY